MLRIKEPVHVVTSVAQARTFINRHITKNYTVDVPEQSPLVVGDEVLFAVVLTNNDSGHSRVLHASVPADLSDTHDALPEFKNVIFPANPFEGIIDITTEPTEKREVASV